MPTLTPVSSASIEEMGVMVRAILRRKSGMSLRDDDTRADNVDALELCHDVIARLWERHATGGAAAAWSDVAAYTATMTHNAWSDHLRQKYPRRASLKNRLRYFLGHQPRYATWDSADGEPLAGRHAWLLEGMTPVAERRMHALRDGSERLPSGSVPRKALERFGAEDWDHLMEALFARLGAPVAVDHLVGIVASLLDLKEDRLESLDDEHEGASAAGIAASAVGGPERTAEARSMLRQLWGAVLALKPDYRRAYLLNLPGPGKMRGDIEVFVMQGVASIEEIAAAIDLDARQLDLALAEVATSPDDRQALGQCHDDLERFCVLWRHLPLPDTLIAKLLDLEPQQVINRRMLALRELARLIGHGRPRQADVRPAAARPFKPAGHRSSAARHTEAI